MIKKCTVNAECKVKAIQPFADHIMVVGEVVRATFDEKELPLIYIRGNYRRFSALGCTHSNYCFTIILRYRIAK